MSDSYSYDADVTDPNEQSSSPIDRMIEDLIEYKLHACSVSELQAMAASHMLRDLEGRSFAAVKEIHDTLFITNPSGEVH